MGLLNTTHFYSSESAPKLTRQAKLKFGRSEVIQNLFHMAFHESLGRFGFAEDLVPDHEVGTIMVREDDAFVAHFVLQMTVKRNAGVCQFNNQGISVDDFIMALAKLSMNLYAQTDKPEDFLFVQKLA